MNENKIDVKEAITAILCAVIVSLVKLGLLKILYLVLFADLGIDLHLS